jgi:hypothetical protein
MTEASGPSGGFACVQLVFTNEIPTGDPRASVMADRDRTSRAVRVRRCWARGGFPSNAFDGARLRRSARRPPDQLRLRAVHPARDGQPVGDRQHRRPVPIDQRRRLVPRIAQRRRIVAEHARRVGEVGQMHVRGDLVRRQAPGRAVEDTNLTDVTGEAADRLVPRTHLPGAHAAVTALAVAHDLDDARVAQREMCDASCSATSITIDCNCDQSPMNVRMQGTSPRAPQSTTLTRHARSSVSKRNSWPACRLRYRLRRGLGEGRALYRAVVEADLEGIVAKRLADPYRPTLTQWHKILNQTYSQRHGRAEWFLKRQGRYARHHC